jgi:DNA polymerase family A
MTPSSAAFAGSNNMARWLTPITELGIKDVIVLDTEYVSRDVESKVAGKKKKKNDGKVPDGNHVIPVCLCAKSLITGREWRIFAERGAPNPLPMDTDVLYVCFAAPAEWSFFLAMGWELPPTIIDLYAERMMQTCEKKETEGNRRGKRYVPTLLRSMATHGLNAMSAAEKEEMRDLIRRGHPYTDDERIRILDYCMEDDVSGTTELFEAMFDELNLPYAILRGNFTRVVAWWGYNGIPADVPAYERFMRNRSKLLTRLIASVEEECGYGVYVHKSDGTMKWDKRGFHALVHRLGLEDDWPKTPSGRDFIMADGDNLPEEEKIFKQMVLRCPYLEPLRQVRKFATTLRNFELYIGDDSRCRVYPNPWWTNTGRANPRNSNFIFTLPKWVRPMVIKPGAGQALAYVDLKSAEVGIAAGLSRDPNMKKCYLDAMNGGDDVYVGFAKLAGAIPPDGNRYSHSKERKLYKVAMLASQYGQMPPGMAKRNGLPLWVAQDLYNKHKSIYRRYWEWIENEVLHAEVTGHMDTLFGWRRPISGRVGTNSLLNFPIQAGCAEILRLATVYMLEAGVAICACVHDAVLIEAPMGEIEEAVAACQGCWRRASAEYLGGFELGSDAKIIRYPARWGDNNEEDAEDIELFGRIQRLLDDIEREAKTAPLCTPDPSQGVVAD